MNAVLAIVLAALSSWPQVADARRTLEAADPRPARTLVAELSAAAAEELLAGGLTARARARLAVMPALAATLAADEDAQVRTAVARAIAARARERAFAFGADESESAAALRLAADRDPAVRLAALEALDRADVDDVRVLAILEQALASPAAAERVRAATILGERAQATERSGASLVERLRAALSGDDERALPADALAVLVFAYGRLAAEAPSPPPLADRLAPLIAARAHPQPRVARAAELAIEQALARAVRQARADEARAALPALAERGYDPAGALDRLVRLTLFDGAEPQRAALLARLLAERARTPAALAEVGALALARAHVLEALAELAAGDATAAAAAGTRARRVLAALVAPPHPSAAARAAVVEAWTTAAQAELTLAVAALIDADPADVRLARALECARAAHRAALGAQVVDPGAATAIDELLRHDLSPWTLLFDVERFSAWPAERSLAVQRELAALLAAVAPDELPGFVPLRDGLEPLADPERAALCARLVERRIEALDERLREIEDDVAYDAELEAERALLLERRWRILMRAREDEGLRETLRDLRPPSDLALRIASRLRSEGRAAECRAVARAALTALEQSGEYWELRNSVLVAQLELEWGSSFTEDGDPVRAREEMEAVLERLEEIEAGLAARGFDEDGLAALRELRSSVMVSLAVNANVKLGDPQQALEWFERAFRLRPEDDFMRVLLACYRARSGRVAEARAALAGVVSAPNLYYNLACTHALLGDVEEAIAWLEREFAENHPGPGTRARQRAWAASDPDLAALRGEPRFERLIHSTEEER